MAAHEQTEASSMMNWSILLIYFFYKGAGLANPLLIKCEMSLILDHLPSSLFSCRPITGAHVAALKGKVVIAVSAFMF